MKYFKRTGLGHLRDRESLYVPDIMNFFVDFTSEEAVPTLSAPSGQNNHTTLRN